MTCLSRSGLGGGRHWRGKKSQEVWGDGWRLFLTSHAVTTNRCRCISNTTNPIAETAEVPRSWSAAGNAAFACMTVCTGIGKRLHTRHSHPTLEFKLGNANNISKHKPCALTTKPHQLTSLAQNESAFVIRWTYNYECFSFSYPTLASAIEPVNPNIQSVGNMQSYYYKIYIERER